MRFSFFLLWVWRQSTKTFDKKYIVFPENGRTTCTQYSYVGTPLNCRGSPCFIGSPTTFAINCSASCVSRRCALCARSDGGHEFMWRDCSRRIRGMSGSNFQSSLKMPFFLSLTRRTTGYSACLTPGWTYTRFSSTRGYERARVVGPDLVYAAGESWEGKSALCFLGHFRSPFCHISHPDMSKTVYRRPKQNQLLKGISRLRGATMLLDTDLDPVTQCDRI